MSTTITEALAEIKTVQKRLAKKRDFVVDYLSRKDSLRDPLEKDGGSPKAIAETRQSINDLEVRVVTLRRAIQEANENTDVTINGVTRSVADWLVWRRDVAPEQGRFLSTMRGALSRVRNQAAREGLSVFSATASASPDKPDDYVVNISEQELAQDIEHLEDTLGQLDGQLSLKNATTIIEVE